MKKSSIKPSQFIRLFFGGRFQSDLHDKDFVEQDVREKGFADFYNRNIKPNAQKAEKERIYYLQKFLFRSRLLAIFWIVAGIGLFFYFTSPTFLGLDSESESEVFAILIGCYFAPLYFLYDVITKFKSQVKVNLFQDIFRFFGDFKYNHEGDDAIELYDQFNILPGYAKDLSSTEDSIMGTYKDVKVRFEELDLVIHSGKSTKTVFRGAVILCSVNKQFTKRTIIKKDLGKFRNMARKKTTRQLGGDLKRVSLEDPEFEKTFETYSEDQIEARHLLTVSFMERLKKLSNFLQSTKTELSFHNQMLLLTFDGSTDLFEPGSIFKKLDLIKESRHIIEQMHLIFSVVDTLQLDNKTGL